MAGPFEILIVAGVFGLVGSYLFVCSRFIRADGSAPERPVKREASPAPPATPSFSRKAHAH